MGLENRLNNAIGTLASIMMHRGRILHDLSGSERKRARVPELLARFEEVRRKELLDPAAAAMLKRNYI